MRRDPWYLNLNDKELNQKFSCIQQEEDKRLREVAREHDQQSKWSLGASVKEINDFRNRYINIMPYEKNRVHLNVTKGNDYINASYVNVDISQQSISSGHYIATQGPTRNTWGQFWQMCYHECHSNNIVIVMVTPLIEKSREKCFPYWPMGFEYHDTKRYVSYKQCPSGYEEDLSIFKQSLEVKYESAKRFDDQYTLTILKLIPKNEDNTQKHELPVKTVYHFYFDQWEDMKKPQEIIPIMKLSQHSHRFISGEDPIIVHCSAGVGRSGTFIALDHLIHNTVDFSEKTNNDLLKSTKSQYDKDLIEQIVLQLRSQRMKMVQLSDQYRFIYHAARYLHNMESH
ncbi:tyrosine protein phosphatase PTP1 PWA37_003132 [Arxiozyma heterogenica]|uniref:tyrosine protein phosphatase PTP1 n=1 Tax=Arxiozyma heterogenica TaxID=278026 RepID=UPI002F1ED76A